MALTGKIPNWRANLLRDGKLGHSNGNGLWSCSAGNKMKRRYYAFLKAKQRPFFDPLILHFHSLDAALAHSLPADQRPHWAGPSFLARGPLTILLPKKGQYPGIVTSGRRKWPPVCRSSALRSNCWGYWISLWLLPAPTPLVTLALHEPAHVEKQLGSKVDYILDGGMCGRIGITIVGIENGKLCVFRAGWTYGEEIEKVAGPVELSINQSGNPRTPGQLKAIMLRPNPFARRFGKP